MVIQITLWLIALIAIAVAVAAVSTPGFLPRLEALTRWIRIGRAKVSLKSKCPACGHRGCLISIADTAGGKMVKKLCLTCRAECYEPTIVRPELWTVK